MTRLILVLLLFWAPLAVAQTKTVGPDDATLSVTVEATETVPFVGEMVLVTIHGVYRRHVTREDLHQPDLAGFSWMQLGPDQWFDSVVNGRKVKNMRRRMALFPEDAGTLRIGAFTHRLTLTDAGMTGLTTKSHRPLLSWRCAPAPADRRLVAAGAADRGVGQLVERARSACGRRRCAAGHPN